MATHQFFALDSTHDDYAAAIDKLATDTSSNRGYTVTQVKRDASHDSNIKIVCAYVDESDLTGDTEDLNKDNFPNALCVDRFVDLDDFRGRGFHLLGEAPRAENPKLTGGCVYLTHGDEGATGGDGKTPQTAKEGWADVGNVLTNTGYYVGGCVYFHQNGTANFGSQGEIDFTNGSAGDETEIRMDHPLWPGVQTDGWLHTATGGTPAGQASWVQDGTEPEVWSQSDWGAVYIDNGPFLVFGGDFPILATSTTWHDDWVLEQVSDLATCRTTPSSYFRDGATMHVHLHDGASPGATGRKILHSAFGYRLNPRRTTSGLANRIRFINCQFFGHDSVSRLLIGTDAPTSLHVADAITFEGGRYIWARGDWFMNGGCSERQWIPSTVGRILWDTSDRRNTPDSEAVEAMIEHLGTAADAWDDYKRHVEIGWVTVGPHPSGTIASDQANPGFPTLFKLDGVYLHHINEDTKGMDRDDADGHPVAIRGNMTTNPIIKRVYCYRVPNGCYLYTPSAAGDGAPAIGSANNCYNYEIADFVLDTNNGKLVNAGGFGVQVGGDNDTILNDNGTGKQTGTMNRICIIDFKPTGSTLGDPAQENQGFACSGNGNDGTVTGVLSIRSNWCFRMDRASHVQAFSSVQTVSSDVVDDDITETIVNGTNTPATLDISTTKVLVVGRQQGTFRRAQIRLTQNGAGTAVVGYYYQTASGLVEIPATGFTDGTSGLTQSGTITFTKPADWISETIGTREGWHIHIKLKSGSWTTTPIMDQCRGIQTGSYLKARDIFVFEPEEGIMWTRANTFFSGSHVIDIDDITLRPKAAQDPDTYGFFRFGSSGDAETIATFQSRTKLAANTDADFDSIFAPSITFLDPLP